MFSETSYIKLVLAFVRLFARLPYRVIILLSNIFACVLYVCFPARRNIAKENIEKCFPSLSKRQQSILLLKNLKSTFLGLIEAGIVWNFPNKVDAITNVHGMENIPKDRGAILVTYHHTATELAGGAIVRIMCFDLLIYRFKNKYLSDFITERRFIAGSSKGKDYEGRIFFHDGDNLRETIKRLRGGERLFYAPDIDLRTGKAQFFSFLGVPTPWEVSAGKFIKLANVDVVPYSLHRTKSKIDICFHKPIVKHGSKESVADILSKINHFTEQEVANEPEDYLWVFKRFHSQPESKESIYREQ